MDVELKTETYFLNPNEVEIVWLDEYGNVTTDPEKQCRPFLWEAKFKGGSHIDPLLVQSIKFPELNYIGGYSGMPQYYLVEVKVITDERVIEANKLLREMARKKLEDKEIDEK